MLWATFCWETLGPGIMCWHYFDTYHLPKDCCRPPFMAMVFPDGLFQQDNIPCHTTKKFRNGLRNMTECSRCWLGLQFPQISTRLSIWTNKFDPWRPYFATCRTTMLVCSCFLQNQVKSTWPTFSMTSCPLFNVRLWIIRHLSLTIHFHNTNSAGQVTDQSKVQTTTIYCFPSGRKKVQKKVVS